MRILVLVVAVICLLVIYKLAKKYWQKVDIEEKIEENKVAIENYEKIKKEGKTKQAENAKEKIDEFLN